MGLAHRIIPTILVRGRQAFKGVGFNSWRPIGLALEKVRVHAMRGVDEVVLLDIGATAEGRGPDLALVEELSEMLFTPLAVGGGVRSVEDMKALLRAGADKVIIGSACCEVPDIVYQCADIAGSQAIVVSVDVGYGNTAMIHCGRTGYSHDPVYCAKWAERAGAGEILLQSIDRDGTMRGYDLDLIRAVTQDVGIPVIASGGAGTYEHMREAIEAGASAVAAGAMFQFGDFTPAGAARYLMENGIEARIQV